MHRCNKDARIRTNTFLKCTSHRGKHITAANVPDRVKLPGTETIQTLEKRKIFAARPM